MLEIRDLKVHFSVDNLEICAVDSVNLDIACNECVVLAGESGSGKTVTAFSITKLLPKNARIIKGSIKFQGNELLSLDNLSLARIRGREIAYIFQEPASFLNPVFSIGDQLMETIVMHQAKTRKEAYKEALNLLAMVRITDPERVILDYPHQLSGGMNQRVFIAMSLACRPRLLIADEPTTSLDVTIEAEIIKLLKELQRTMGFSLLFITHNLSIAKKIADRVCVMYKGKIVEQAGVKDLFVSAVHYHTKELLRSYEKIGRL